MLVYPQTQILLFSRVFLTMQTLEIKILSLLLPAMHNISLATVPQVTLSLLPSAS